MIKFPMFYVDILFPLNLGPLTYLCPDRFKLQAQPGMLVTAPLKNRLARGIILRTNTSPPAGKIREIISLSEGPPVLSRGLLELIAWMADYYIAPDGIVLRQTVPPEIFESKSTRRRKTSDSEGPGFQFVHVPDADLEPIAMSAAQRRYHTLLLQSPSWAYEYSVVSRLTEIVEGPVLVILPEVPLAEALYCSLKEKLGGKICIMHGEIAKGRRSETVEGILSGKYTVILGTRLALFAPVRRPSLIMVLHEHSLSYKTEDALRFSVRDVAVKRGYLDKTTVLLSSITPSADSYFNAMTGKYSMVRPSLSHSRKKIRVIDMRFAKRASDYLARDVVDSSKKRIASGKKVVFFVNRRGHSTLLVCEDCGAAENCTKCGIPLVLHKKEKALRCHYCGQVSVPPLTCGNCGSHNISMLGAGTQKVQEEIEALLGVEALRIDSDHIKKVSDMKEALAGLTTGSSKVLIGTKMMTRRLAAGEPYAMAAAIGIDNTLNFPDFRAAEKTYSEFAALSELVEPDGVVFIQTRMPANSVFKYLKAGDYPSFIEEELSLRRRLSYPPFARFLQIEFPQDERVSREILNILDNYGGKIEVLERTDARADIKSVSYLLLKSKDRNILNEAAKKVRKWSEDRKQNDIVFDVDPL